MEHRLIDTSHNIQHLVKGEFFLEIIRDAFLEKTERISECPVCNAGNIVQCAILCLYAFLVHYLAESVRYGVDRDSVKIIALTAGQDRVRKLLNIRSRQDKDDIGRRFLQGL